MKRGSLGPTRVLLALLALLLLLRLGALGVLPLMDTTEARYAEIGRRMAESGDWVTPRHTAGEPFWGKPPLSIWLTAASFRLLGVSELAARLPHYLCALLVGFLVWRSAAQRSRREAVLAVALLAGSTLFLVSAGAVMTDMALAVGTTLAMHGYWSSGRAPDRGGRRDRWLPFVGLAVGLLAKGPVAFVLIAVPLLLWTLWSTSGSSVSRRLPWAGGAALVLMAVLPWYALAEVRTPGFLDYFLVGEHWHRFMTPGWKGDLYGSAHRTALGTIWWYAFVALLPWSVVVPLAAWWWRRDGAAPASTDDRAWQRYLLLWAAVPLLLFTAARNIIWTYVLPAIPPLALWTAASLARHARSTRVDGVLIAGLAGLLGASALAVWLGLSEQGERRTARAVVAAYEARRTGHQPLIFVGALPHSASFYSRGTAQAAQDGDTLGRYLDRGAFVAVRSDAGASLPLPDRFSVTAAGRFGSYDLLLVQPGGTPSGPLPARLAPSSRLVDQ